MSRPTLFRHRLLAALLLLGGFNSCHQNPAVPDSLIPLTCQLERADYIDTTAVTVYTYTYDAFGNRTSSHVADSTHTRTDQVYTFDADQYLVSQKVNGSTYTYTYTGSPKLISHIGGGINTYDYTYDGTTLKTFVIKTDKTTTTYAFAGGRLSGITASSGDVFTVNADGKIAQQILGTITTNYQYDGQGQVTQLERINAATGLRVVNKYTYDAKLSTTNAALRVRGFPVLPLDGQPGYEVIGGPVLINNYSTVSTITYRKNAAGTEDATPGRTLVYTYLYNSAGFSLGYARSDGARAKFYYINCKTP